MPESLSPAMPLGSSDWVPPASATESRCRSKHSASGSDALQPTSGTPASEVQALLNAWPSEAWFTLKDHRIGNCLWGRGPGWMTFAVFPDDDLDCEVCGDLAREKFGAELDTAYSQGAVHLLVVLPNEQEAATLQVKRGAGRGVWVPLAYRRVLLSTVPVTVRSSVRRSSPIEPEWWPIVKDTLLARWRRSRRHRRSTTPRCWLRALCGDTTKRLSGPRADRLGSVRRHNTFLQAVEQHDLGSVNWDAGTAVLHASWDDAAFQRALRAARWKPPADASDDWEPPAYLFTEPQTISEEGRTR